MLFHKKSNHTLAIVFWVAILVGGAVYFWQESNTATKEAQLKTEVNRLQTQVSQMERVKDSDLMKLDELKRKVEGLKSDVRDDSESEEGQVATTPTPEPAPAQEPTQTPAPTPTPTEPAISAPMEEVKFTECAHVTNFMYRDWYASLKDAAFKLNINLREGSSSCYSEAGNTLIFLIPKEDCDMGDFYRFNTLTRHINKASFLNKGLNCTPSPQALGKREGEVIKLTGSAEKLGCKWKVNYDYNYVKNTVEPMSYRTLCEGESEWTEKAL
jgi:hypothetical protein